MEEGLSSYVVASATSVNGGKTIQQVLDELDAPLKSWVESHTWREWSQLTLQIAGGFANASGLYGYIVYRPTVNANPAFEFQSIYEDANQFDIVVVYITTSGGSYISDKFFNNTNGYVNSTKFTSNAFTGTITIYGLK